jgi:hypothetical protein
MPEDITVDKAKFDAVLRKIAKSKPTSLEQVKVKLKAGMGKQSTQRKITERRGAVVPPS